MTPVRRLRTLALALPVWIVMILTGGEWCLMPGSATAHPMVSSAAGAGHSAGGQHDTRLHDVGAPDESHAGALDGRATAPDGTMPPGAPAHHGDGGGCESQAACSVAITPASWHVARGSGLPIVAPTIESSERPATLVYAPEIPPPRA
jgi:hypothetical protein